MQFELLSAQQREQIEAMSAMAKTIVKEHFDPIIGAAQNDYMIQMFQTVEAITDQLTHGYQYYFVLEEGHCIGFLAFYPRGEGLYLSKFYLYKEERGKGYSRQMLAFVIERARELGRSYIELNVNKNNSAVKAYEKLGFEVVRTEKNDIGAGYYMDDYVFRLDGWC